MTQTILFLDDEINVLNALRRLLRNEEYQVLTVSSGKDALSLLEKQSIELVISDQRMPEMMGTEFLQRVKRYYPDTVRVVLSGYADIAMILDAINQGEIFRFLMKPWNDDELKVTIRQCFAHYDLVQENQRLSKQIQEQNDVLLDLNLQLAEVVDTKNRGLKIYETVLNTFGMPIVVINNQWQVVVMSTAMNFLGNPFQKIRLGSLITDFMPEALLSTLETLSLQDFTQEIFRKKQVQITIDNRTFDVIIQRLGNSAIEHFMMAFLEPSFPFLNKLLEEHFLWGLPKIKTEPC